VSTPRLLDLFCCAGGAGMGYHRAGFEVVGVDIEPQPHYPFEFIQADALAYAASHADEFDVIHASPPCQVHSATANAHRVKHPDLLAPTRDLLRQLGRPYVIENVERAPLIDPVMLCGTMFGLRAADTDGVELQLQRHRLFETSFPVGMAPAPCAHDSTPVGGSYKGSRRRTPADRDQKRRGGYTPALSVRAELLGIDWMNMRNEHELAQAIPPAYTEFIGRQLIEHLAVRA
jgi:DNA (cytosine-5)-methyltransferase 1